MKNNKNTFSMYYFGIDIYLSKDAVQFNGDLGVVIAYIETENGNCPLIGVVDRDFKTVMPLRELGYVHSIQSATKDSFLSVQFHEDRQEYSVVHTNIDGESMDLYAFNFEKVDEGIFLLYYGDYACLYDASTCQYLTPGYNYVGPFVYSQEYDRKVARVNYYIKNDKGEIINDLSTTISTHGDILTPIHDLVSGDAYNELDLYGLVRLIKK